MNADAPSSCSICIERISTTEHITSLPECHHKFHSKCFLEYIRYNILHPQDTITCPICRRIVIDNRKPASSSSNVATLEMIYIRDEPPIVPDHHIFSLTHRRQMSIYHGLMVLACGSLFVYMLYLSVTKVDDDDIVQSRPIKMPPQ